MSLTSTYLTVTAESRPRPECAEAARRVPIGAVTADSRPRPECAEATRRVSRRGGGPRTFDRHTQQIYDQSFDQLFDQF